MDETNKKTMKNMFINQGLASLKQAAETNLQVKELLEDWGYRFPQEQAEVEPFVDQIEEYVRNELLKLLQDTGSSMDIKVKTLQGEQWDVKA